jgi:tight adherence protein B
MFANNILSMAVIGALVGIAVWCTIYGVLVLFGGSRARVKSRVKQFVANQGQPVLSDEEARERQRETLFAELDSRWEDRGLFKALSDEIEAADLHITPTELLLIQISLGFAAAVLLFFVPTVGWLLAPLGFFWATIAVRSYVRYLGKRRIQRFEEQLPNNLAVLAGSVRGGFSLYQAMQMLARESAEPSKTEFTRVIQEISLGNPMSTALEGLAKRVPTEDVDILITAIIMQQTTGGNLTHVLDVVAATIRERHRVTREIRAMTASQRVQATVMALLPIMLGFVLYYISPQYMSNLFQPGWVLCMPGGALFLSVIGFIVMRRMAEIDV